MLRSPDNTSDVPFGFTKRQAGSRNALAEICAIVEDRVEPEIENITDHTQEGIAIATGILKGVACGYGGPEQQVDEPRLTQLVARLDDYDRSPKSDPVEHEELTTIEKYDTSLRKETPDTSDYAKESICNAMEDIRDRNDAAVLDIPAPGYYKPAGGYGGFRKSEQSWVKMKSQGIQCSVNAVEKIASCDMSGEKGVADEVGCLEEFTNSLRHFDYSSPDEKVVYAKHVEEIAKMKADKKRAAE